MMKTLSRRLHHEEHGYALVIAIILLSVMMVLILVTLDAGNSALEGSSKGIQWAKTLTVAEAGVNDVVTRLGASRTAANPCQIGTGTVCSGGGGEYQVSWTATSTGGVKITSIGYYPSMAAFRFNREVQVTYEPASTFKYALFSQDVLDIKNNGTVVGDVYSTGNVTVEQNMNICGSITAANGNITLNNNDKIEKSDATVGCTGQSGNLWAGGSIFGANGATVEGNATASGPTGTTCSPTLASYTLSTMTVGGVATACGKITSVTATGGINAGAPTTQPAVQTLPPFTFDPNNYSNLVCYPTGGTCGSNLSSTAVSGFNTYVSAHLSNLSGTFAVWQASPSQSTVIDLNNLTNLGGDVTLITNAPIYFGNTNQIDTTATSALGVFVSTYQPPAGTTCDVNGGDCSIYGLNAIQFGTNVAGLLYTTGKLAFKNNCNAASCTQFEGAIYANSMDVKNGVSVVYNSAIERILGFGDSLQQSLWQEINV